MAAGLSALVRTLRAARRVRADLALTSDSPLGSLPVTAEHQTLGSVASRVGGRAREEWRYLQGLRNHAPFAQAPSITMLDQAEEYRFGGRPAVGLGLAAANAQLAVSWPGDEWNCSIMTLDRHTVEEGDDGELRESTELVSVTHCSSDVHVEGHEDFLRHLALPSPFGGREIWADRARLYPQLAFLPRVEGQLAALPPGSAKLAQVTERLSQLQAAASEWNPTKAPFPTWRSPVSPEGESRKRLCLFSDQDGVDRCFDLHARFTPGPGRIHFRIRAEHDVGILIIAHVGTKL